MAAPTDETGSDTAKQILHDIQAVNEQLLLAGLREQLLAEQLRRQLAFISAITTSQGEGVFVVDGAGYCTFVNPAAERMLGWAGDELRGQPIGRVFPGQVDHGTSSGTVPAALRDVLHVGVTHRDDDVLFVHCDGGMLPAAYTAAPIITNGQIVGAVVTFRDMTEVRRLQEIREEYLSLISHDLRAPLTVISGHAQILLGGLTKQGLTKEAKSAKVMVESSIRMTNMIEELLNRSRTDPRTLAHQRAVVDLVAVVRQLLEQTMSLDDYQRVRLDTIASLRVVVDVIQIERVIVNLLTNALKFSPPDTPIIIQISEQATDAIIAVTDQGIGIAPEDLPHLFEKYYRARTLGHVAGHGLGLYSSRLIVEAHGGRIWAESIVGVGSTFNVALPRSG